jgi:hypothetical protein
MVGSEFAYVRLLPMNSTRIPGRLLVMSRISPPTGPGAASTAGTPTTWM